MIQTLDLLVHPFYGYHYYDPPYGRMTIGVMNDRIRDEAYDKIADYVTEIGAEQYYLFLLSLWQKRIRAISADNHHGLAIFFHHDRLLDVPHFFKTRSKRYKLYKEEDALVSFAQGALQGPVFSCTTDQQDGLAAWLQEISAPEGPIRVYGYGEISGRCVEKKLSAVKNELGGDRIHTVRLDEFCADLLTGKREGYEVLKSDLSLAPVLSS